MAEESKLFHGRVGNGNQWMWLQKNAEQTNKIIEAQTTKELQELQKREAAAKQSAQRMQKFKELGDKAAYDAEKERQAELIKEQEAAEFKLQARRNAIKEKAARTAEIFEQNRYKQMSKRQQQEYQKNVGKELQAELQLLKDKSNAQMAEKQRLNNVLKSDKASAKDKEEATKRIKQIDAEQQKTQSEINDKSAAVSQVNNIINQLFSEFSTKAEKAKSAKEAYDKSELAFQQARAELQNFEAEHLKKIRAAKLAGDKKTLDNLNEEYKKKIKLVDETEKQAAADKKRLTEADKAAKKEEEHQKRLDQAEKNRQELLNRFTHVNAMSTKIEENLNVIFGDRAKMMARLQGSTEDWGEAVDSVSDSIGFSGIARKGNVIQKMAELVDSGVAYNIELRAFLAETSENIASTFNAFDSTLLRMIRLQQADTTAARLGMEATLTKLFNQLFNDHSYLKNVSDSVSQAILDASANLSRDDSLEFEYTLQKWLGSLYSLGVSNDTVTAIASGINYLGSGNYKALSDNTPLQTLLTLGASYSGSKTYDQMLLYGMSSEDTNNLLRGIIEMLAEIANNQSNNVTTSAYADLFNMSVTDLRAFASLTTNEINQLYKNTVSYQSLVDETSSQLSQISNRMSLSQLVDNAISNAELGIATTIGGNAFTYATWKALGLLTDYVGEIKIPSILAAGFGLSSDIDLLNVAKTAMVGLGAIGSLTGALGSMLNGGPSSLTSWDFDEYTTRGTTLTLLSPGSTGTSYSAKIGVGGGSSSDIESVSMETATEKAYESSQTSQEEIDEGKQIPQKIYEAIAGDSTITVLNLLQEIDQRLDPNRVFYTAIAGVLTTDAATRVSTLSAQLSAQQMSNATENALPESTQATATANLNKQGNALSGSSILTGEELSESLENIISAAVQTALTNMSYSSAGSGLPVTVTNLRNGGIV